MATSVPRRTVAVALLHVLIAFDAVALLFAGIVHLVGAQIPLGVAVFDEPPIIPAGVMEGLAGLLFTFATYVVFARRTRAWSVALAAHLFAGAGFLLGIWATRLQQLSDFLIRQGVAGVGEPSDCIVAGDGVDRLVDGLQEGVPGAGAQAAQDRLDLGERLLDGRAVRRVGRQKEQLAITRLDRLADALCLMHTQVVQHHDLSRSQGGSQLLLDVALEGRGIHRPLNRPGRLQPLGRQRRHQCRVPAVIARHGVRRPLIMRCPAVEPRQRGVRAAFVDEDELLRVELCGCLPPGRPGRLVALAGCQ